jgi:hypothetical protein
MRRAQGGERVAASIDKILDARCAQARFVLAWPAREPDACASGA